MRFRAVNEAALLLMRCRAVEKLRLRPGNASLRLGVFGENRKKENSVQDLGFCLNIYSLNVYYLELSALGSD